MDIPNGWLLGRENGVETRVYDGENPGEVVQDTRQDVGDILDLNTQQRNYGTGCKMREGLGEHVARIPNVIVTKLKQEGILDDPKAFLAWLDDKENYMFRTNPMPLTHRAMQRKYGT